MLDFVFSGLPKKHRRCVIRPADCEAGVAINAIGAWPLCSSVPLYENEMVCFELNSSEGTNKGSKKDLDQVYAITNHVLCGGT
jgi:hypothetical protein